MLDFTETSDLKDLEKFQIKADLMKKNVLSAADPFPESFPGRSLLPVTMWQLSPLMC